MLRRTRTLSFLIASFLMAMAATGPATAADVRAAQRRLHHEYEYVVPPGARYPGHPPPVNEESDFLISPADGMVRAVRPWFSAPLLPGSATLPGYYGTWHSYDYRGPYYGGPYVGYWDRLPYACGVYGYC
jgi:hypothetical protein